MKKVKLFDKGDIFPGIVLIVFFIAIILCVYLMFDLHNLFK